MVPYRSTSSTSQRKRTCMSLPPVTPQPRLMGAAVTIRKGLEGAVKSPPVPDGPRVDKLLARHPPVRDHLVEQRRRDPDVHGGFLAREAAAWNRSRLGKGARHDQEVCLSVIAASARRTDSAPDSTFSIKSARSSRRRRAST